MGFYAVHAAATNLACNNARVRASHIAPSAPPPTQTHGFTDPTRTYSSLTAPPPPPSPPHHTQATYFTSITSHHTTPHHITSHHITSHPITSHPHRTPLPQEWGQNPSHPAPPHTTVRKVATPHNPISKLEGLPPFETPPSGPARHCHRPPWQAPPLLCLSPHAVRPSKNNQAASGARRKCRLYTAGIPSTITCFLVSGDPGLSPLPIMCKCNKPPTHGPLHLSGVCSLTTCGHKCMRPLGSVAVLSGPYADGQTRGRLTGGGAGVVMRWRSWGHR